MIKVSISGDLGKALKREAMKAIERKGVECTCSNCGLPFRTYVGMNICPHCGVSISIKFS